MGSLLTELKRCAGSCARRACRCGIASWLHATPVSVLASVVVTFLTVLSPYSLGAPDPQLLVRENPATLPVVFDLMPSCPFDRQALAQRITTALDANELSSNTEVWSREQGGFFLNIDCVSSQRAGQVPVTALHAALSWSYPDSLKGSAVYPDIEVDTAMSIVSADSEALLETVVALFEQGLARYLESNGLD